jgi:hypothetical protein
MAVRVGAKVIGQEGQVYLTRKKSWWLQGRAGKALRFGAKVIGQAEQVCGFKGIGQLGVVSSWPSKGMQVSPRKV